MFDLVPLPKLAPARTASYARAALAPATLAAYTADRADFSRGAERAVPHPYRRSR